MLRFLVLEKNLLYCAGVLASSLALAAGAAHAQAPKPEAKASPTPVPVTTESPAPQTPRVRSSGRDQFIAPVMGIDIKGEGISLPQGVAQQPDEPIKPPATAK